MGEGELAVAGEEEAEGEVGVEVVGVGGDGAAVGGLGGGDWAGVSARASWVKARS